MSEDRKRQRRKAFELELDDTHLIAIGHVAVRSAMLDLLVDLTFQQIISLYPLEIKAELEKLASPKRIKVIKESLIEMMPEDAKGISDFISEIFSARDKRNDVLHRTWRSTETAEVKALVEISHDAVEIERRRVTAMEVRKLADQFLDLALEMGDWKMRAVAIHANQYHASLGKSYTPIWERPAPRPSETDRT